jgi:hypothetical protein
VSAIGTSEPNIAIGGVNLTTAQAMTVRCAVEAPSVCHREVRVGYPARIIEIKKLIEASR